MEDHSRFDRCSWRGCRAECVDEVRLCSYHYDIAGRMFIEHRSVFGTMWQKANAALQGQRQLAGRAKQADHLAERARRMAEQSVVYYMRIGNHVKIGYTTNLRARLTGLRVDAAALLATEPGGRDLETQRHREFATERVGRREDFNPSRRLLAHIETVKDLHGGPRITTYRAS